MLNVYRKWKQAAVTEDKHDQVIEGEYKPS
jgi:hypothetical protein